MGRVKTEDILGYDINDEHNSFEIVCAECATDEDLKDVTEDQIILEGSFDREEERLFCDRCKKEL